MKNLHKATNAKAKRAPRPPVFRGAVTAGRAVVDQIAPVHATPAREVISCVGADDPIAVADARAGNVADALTVLTRQRRAILLRREAALRDARIAEDALKLASMVNGEHNRRRLADAKALLDASEQDLAEVDHDLFPYLVAWGYGAYGRQFSERQWVEWRHAVYFDLRTQDGASDGDIKTEFRDWGSATCVQLAKTTVRERAAKISPDKSARMLRKYREGRDAHFAKIVSLVSDEERRAGIAPRETIRRIASAFLDDDFGF